MAKKPSSELIMKAINKLNKEFDFNLETDKVKIYTYSGSADADAFRWFTLGVSPEIHSDCTLSDFVKAKDVSYSYRSWDGDGVHVTNEEFKENSFMTANDRNDKPSFSYTKHDNSDTD